MWLMVRIGLCAEDAGSSVIGGNTPLLIPKRA